ncbi:MAG: ChrR family anti-sigma-E factor [Alphaproteobacteria bacterium]|nr:ChrR family anti-sigma-E factor [Alphaproteobacteria bacterium]
MPTHHPDEVLLLEYAAGSLDEAKSLLVATHLALCPACRGIVRSGEATGAALAFDGAAEDVGAPPDVTGHAVERTRGPVTLPPGPAVPEPLRVYLGAPVSELGWVPVLSGMRAFPLPVFKGRSSVRLLAIEPGRRMPRHTHEGDELTLVLQGSFADATGNYARGDVATADASIDHQPQAGAGELCLCLAVEDAPLRLTGINGALINMASAVRKLLSR